MLSPFIGVVGGALDQNNRVDYTLDFPVPDPLLYGQKDDIDTRYLGGEIGLEASFAIGERWTLGVKGGVALLHARGELKHRLTFYGFTGTSLLTSQEQDSDSTLAVKADAGLSASYRFAGGITLALGVNASYLSAVATTQSGNTLTDPLTATTLAFGTAWMGQTNLTLTIPF